jgi:hypothetical protein
MTRTTATTATSEIQVRIRRQADDQCRTGQVRHGRHGQTRRIRHPTDAIVRCAAGVQRLVHSHASAHTMPHATGSACQSRRLLLAPMPPWPTTSLVYPLTTPPGPCAAQLSPSAPDLLLRGSRPASGYAFGWTGRGRIRTTSAQLSDLAGGRSGLIVCFHHLLADGIGSLAVLARLTDASADRSAGCYAPPVRTGPQAPSRRVLAADA